MTVHSHSTGFGGGPGGAPLLKDQTQPLPAPISKSSFSYSSVACKNPAPFNDIALRFAPDYAGVDGSGKVRFIHQGNVANVEQAGPNTVGTVEGKITTFLCKNDQEGDKIQIAYEGQFRQTSDNKLKLEGTTVNITGGTGKFASLQGSGAMTGSFKCLQGVLEREGPESCAELGSFSDAVFQLKGHYKTA